MSRIDARVDAGDLSPRIGAGGPRNEIRVLAQAFDPMLGRLEDAFERQREFVADASHKLRTPLTVIRGQLGVLARQPEPSAEDVRRVERLVSDGTLRADPDRIAQALRNLLVNAIAQAVVEVHGGTVRVADSPLGGARLVVELPGFAPHGPAHAVTGAVR